MTTYKKFTHEDYVMVHELVLKAQEGDEDAKIKLFEIFQEFINRYVDLLKEGKYNLYNYSVKRFLSFFIPDKKVKNAIDQHYHKPMVRSEIDKAAMLIKGIFSFYEESDIRNDLFIVFWTLCKRYKDTRPSFHNYLKMCFHYEVLSYYRPMIKNSAVNNAQNHIPLEDSSSEEYNGIEMEMSLNDANKYMSIKKTKQLKVTDRSSVYEDEHLNTNWVTGITCSGEFSVLTNYERNLLLESYVKKRTDQEIADRYGLSRATINRRKQAAKEKLLKELQKSNMICKSKD